MVSPGRRSGPLSFVAPAGAVARLQPLPRAGMLASDPEPGFVLDPVVLDAAGQVIGFWAADRLERGKVVFPFRLAALDVFGPPPVPGETLSCVASIALSGDALVCSDIDVLDPGGAPRMRLTAWEDKRFDVPDRFRALTVPSALPPLSTAWQEPVAPYSGAAGCLQAARRAAPDRPRPVEAGLGEPRPRPPRTRALRVPRGSRGAPTRMAGRTHGRQRGRRRPPAVRSRTRPAARRDRDPARSGRRAGGGRARPRAA